MPIIGNPLNSVAFLTDSFNGNGSTTAFTMSVAPATSSSILVNITGVTQAPSTYSVVGTTLTFSTAPPSGTANISVRYLGIPASGVTTTAYRTLTEFTATASQTTFTPPSYTVGFIAVYQNGVMLGSTDYTATNGTTVVLAVGALVNDLVTTESFYVSSVLNALPVTGGTISGNLVVTGTASLGTPLPVASGGTGLAAIPHTVQYFTSGSGTYTYPANCKFIKVTICGGGGGGAGGASTTNGSDGGAGGTGGNTTFGVANLVANGGGGGTGGNASGAGAGGSKSGDSGNGFGYPVSLVGGQGMCGKMMNSAGYQQGGSGGVNPFGGSGSGAAPTGAGGAGATNSGSGGGGGAGGAYVSAQLSGGGGGGAGGYIIGITSSCPATLAYAVGAAGTAGVGGTGGGTNGQAGGAGGSGFILVEEFYV